MDNNKYNKKEKNFKKMFSDQFDDLIPKVDDDDEGYFNHNE